MEPKSEVGSPKTWPELASQLSDLDEMPYHLQDALRRSRGLSPEWSKPAETLFLFRNARSLCDWPQLPCPCTHTPKLPLYADRLHMCARSNITILKAVRAGRTGFRPNASLVRPKFGHFGGARKAHRAQAV